MEKGTVVRVSGPVVIAEGLEGAKMYDVVRVGELGLIGEVIRLEGEKITVQVYEDTTGIRPGDRVENTRQALSVELGPGLLTSIYDGIQRPLNILREKSGDFISRGLVIPPLDEKRKWEFEAVRQKGDMVSEGEVLGEVQETPLIRHKIMLPVGMKGEIKELRSGNYTIREPIGTISSGDGTRELYLSTRWTVRIPRPYTKKLPPDTPLVTGQRVLDTFFPVAKGGTAAIPGPFGSGKCVSGDTPILLADGRFIEIETLYNSLRGKAVVERIGEEELLRLSEDVELFSYSPVEGKIVRSKSRVLYRGYSDTIIALKTASGREVKVTPSHRLFVVGKDGKVEQTEARNIKMGEKIAAVSRIPYSPANFGQTNYLADLAIGSETSSGNSALRIITSRKDVLRSICSSLLQSGISFKIIKSEQSLGIDIAGGKDRILENIITSSHISPYSGVAYSMRSASGSPALKLSLATIEQKMNDIFADEVVSIRKLAGPFPVYDFSLPDYWENFVGGEGGLLLHNTVTQQQLAKWSDSNVVVYVGCGERGNEMTEVLVTFPELKDPKSGRPLLERTILVANTSNMPVAAREASIYTGITMAEYYRDMGYDVALMADSTSRWAEALREISGRLEEMPGEEGYPAYLGKRLAEFYERSGRVVVLSPDARIGSVTIVGAVSPPGGDFSEPVSQNTLRVTRVFWALDASLAGRRHFPAINWLTSYSLYVDDLAEWGRKNVAKEWPEIRARALEILQKESELQDIVQLVGYDALPETEKGILDIAKMIREDYLQQSAFDDVDTYSSIKKQYLMLKTILLFGDYETEAIKQGAQASQVSSLDVKNKISRMKWTPEAQIEQLVEEINSDIRKQFENLLKSVVVA